MEKQDCVVLRIFLVNNCTQFKGRGHLVISTSWKTSPYRAHFCAFDGRLFTGPHRIYEISIVGPDEPSGWYPKLVVRACREHKEEVELNMRLALEDMPRKICGSCPEGDAMHLVIGHLKQCNIRIFSRSGRII